MEDKITCPRCGLEQPNTELCTKCGINIPRYRELQKRRTAVPGDKPQRVQPRQEKRQGVSPSPEDTEGPPPESDQPETEVPRTPKPPEFWQERTGGNEASGKLIGIGNLFEKTWDVFKRRVGTLIALYLLTIALVLIPVGFFILIAYLISLALPGTTEALIVAGSVVGATAGIIAGCWGFGAFFCAVADDRLSIRDALEKGGQKIWPFIWLFSLLGYIVPGGFLLFFIPGVLFMVWFAFAVFILPNDDEKGMNAVLKSKEYVKGYWFDIFGRLFIIWLASVGVGMIPVLGLILSIMFFPFEMIYVYLVYEDLKSVKGDISYPYSVGEKLKWIGIATLGYIVAPIIIISLLGTAFMHSLSVLKETMPY
jgi:hypothetical protein